MTFIKLLTAPIRRLLNWSVVQFGIVIIVILFLEYQDDNTIGGRIYSGLDALVRASLDVLSRAHELRSFSRAFLTVGLTIAYGFIALWVFLEILRRIGRNAVDFAGRHNLFWLRDSIARERGIAAYRAWEPLEHIRPAEIPQFVWEERYAWPANDEPPYPSLWKRIAFEAASVVLVVALILVLLQLFTPVPALSWIAAQAKAVVGSFGGAGH
jgi:putative flippase GtrA